MLLVLSACIYLCVSYAMILFCLVLQTWSILLIIISVFNTSVKSGLIETTLGLVQYTHFASGVVDLNIICLAFNVDGNISALVTVNLNCRGLSEEILERSAAVNGEKKSFNFSGLVYASVV